MSTKPKPQLPAGNASIFNGATENLSFHRSPESFITSRVLQYHKSHPEAVNSRVPVRAKILNRNVVIVSSYRHVEQILSATAENEDSEPPYVATAPYNRLMVDFFPPPNLLLQDGCPHSAAKKIWKASMKRLEDDAVDAKITTLVDNLLGEMQESNTFDVYNVLKDFAWRVFLSTFLDLTHDDPEYEEYVRLQEDLLRGQFSLFPVSVNTGFWHSPRKTGVDSRKKLQAVISRRLQSRIPSWVSIDVYEQRSREEIQNHILMATSSLAVKGFASLMTALLLNYYLFVHEDDDERKSLNEWVECVSDGERDARMEAVLSETLRLSPPIVGVMRRATAACTLPSKEDDKPDVLIPKGWDAWLYFPGGNRDAAAFGSDADLFRPERYLSNSGILFPPRSFGAGSKSCLGAPFIRRAALTVLQGFQRRGARLRGSVDAEGLRGWLGWQITSPESWSKDVKQLPTQRPANPVMLSLSVHG